MDKAISECQGQRNPTATTCIKLAAYLTIKRELYGFPAEPMGGYSFATPDVISTSGGSEFLNAVQGRKIDDILPTVNELVETLRLVQPHLYGAFMGKLEGA